MCRCCACCSRRAAAAVGETPLMREALQLARRRCDEMNDKPPARAAMKRAVLDTPADLLADLILALTHIVVAMGVADELKIEKRSEDDECKTN